jgi:hypothetical protein
MPAYYNEYIDASISVHYITVTMEGSKTAYYSGCIAASITAYYNGYLEASTPVHYSA